MESTGAVYWITGLSGVGKSTIGRHLVERIKGSRSDTVFLDGDTLREVFGNDLGHSPEDRLAVAMRNAGLCKLLSDQGLVVICATISLFRACQQWNRRNIVNYHEIFVEASIQTLHERDPKGIYQKSARHEMKHVVGVDIKPEFPENPDLHIVNDGSHSPEEIVERILRKFASSPSRQMLG